MDKKTRMFLILSISQVIFTCTFIVTSLRAEPTTGKHIYTKADLEVLQEGKNYLEFFNHAKDVVPTQRDKSWFEMVTTMATDLVDEYRLLKKYDNQDFELIEKLSEWPELVKDEFFQVKRNSFNVDYLKRCFLKEKKSLCRQRMKNFWKTARKDPETGHQLLSLSEGFFPQDRSWSYIQSAANSEFAQFYCQRPLVQKSLLKEIYNLTPELIKNDHKKENLLILANNTCWSKASEFLKEQLLSTQADDQRGVFYTLTSLDLLNNIESSTYLIKYFLEGPEKGELLNLAWARLELISQNYDLRLAIIKSLKDIDPLPGSIFALTTKSEKRIFTNHLSKNFPEYISLYSKTCVSYLTGEVTFPFGNPTVECHELFNIDKEKSMGQKMISQPIHLKYSGIMKKSVR